MDKGLADCLLGLLFRAAKYSNIDPFIVEIRKAIETAWAEGLLVKDAKTPGLRWLPADVCGLYWVEGDAIDVTDRERALLEAERAVFKAEFSDDGILAHA